MPRLSAWERRTPLTITVVWRGGAEAWYEVRARGCLWRVPGVAALHDLMSEIYGE